MQLIHPIINPRSNTRFPFPILAALVLALLPSAAPANPTYPDLSASDNARLAWWVDARYGMFIHWGVASILGVELSWDRKAPKPLDIRNDPAGAGHDPVYDNLYKTWNPEKFDPREWVRVAKAAGMHYMVLTAKHHDGFCLWNTAFTDYKITNSPFKRDVVREFVNACREADMKVGIYYSQRDWHHPDYGIGDNRKYIDYMNGQLTELLTYYGKIDLIWFDSYGKGDLKTFWHIDETWQLLKRLAPDAVINNRLANLGNYNAQGKPYWADFDTPEQKIGALQIHRPWESCMTLVGHQWGYRPGGEIYSLKQVIQSLVSCATGDGNLLLNTGPMPDGRIEPRQVERLKEAGDWLNQYGQSIYGTRGGPWENGTWGGSTRKAESVFVHVFDWKGGETIRLPALPQKVLASRILTGGKPIIQESAEGLSLTVFAGDRHPINTVIELTLDGPATGVIKGHPEFR